MSTLFACVHAAEFPAQALVRLRPDLQAEPVAVMEGKPPQESVCAMNRHAVQRGVTLGMTPLDAETIPDLRLLARSLETEAAARAVLLECAAKFSPRIQEASEGTACAFVLDIAGTERLFGPPQKLAERLREELATAGFRVSIAVSANYETARMKAAAAARGVTVVPEGHEAVALAKLPVTSLPLTPEHAETFATWGIRTLGELAALPEAELIARMGQSAHPWHQAAWGAAPHMFTPIEEAFTLREFCAFDDAVEQIDSLLFVGARMIDALVARSTNRALCLALLTVRMKLEGGLAHELVLRPAIPSADRKFLLKLLQLEIAAHPPQAAVVALEIAADAGRSSTVQLGLFAPQTPEPSRLDVTIARLKSIVGEDRVGSPLLEDSHRPASFRMEAFRCDARASETEPQPARIALRRMRPSVPLSMILREMRPIAFRDGSGRFEVKAAYGPWRTSGCWWSEGAWNLEEWDVLAARADGSQLACLLVCDCTSQQWRLEAVYD